MTAISERQRSCVYIYKKQNNAKLLYKKRHTFFKKQDNVRYVYLYKKQDTLLYAVFGENFESGIFIQKA